MTDATPVVPTLEQVEAQLAQQIAAELPGVAASFAAHFPQDKLGEVAAQLAKEQISIMSMVFPSMVDPEVLKTQPDLLIEVMNIKTGRRAIFPSVKRLESAQGDPQIAIAQACMLSFLMTPSVRAVLRMHGYQYRFIDPKPKPEPRIKLVRG